MRTRVVNFDVRVAAKRMIAVTARILGLAPVAQADASSNARDQAVDAPPKKEHPK
ncbi:hypothetical protein [Acidovorax carolinensis]|uniref:hypothetical protein n=1 Tax=Acidovorax carolinensis TaxID=553814 RepID=UPI0012FF7BE8|nr:hypothetical protein [Acidovorax carolinensis]